MDKLDLRADLESRVFQNKKKSELPKWLFFGALAISIVAGLTYLNKNKLATVFEGRGGEIVQLLKPYVKPEPVTQIIEYELPQRQVAEKPKEVTSQAIELWQPENKENQRERQTVFNDDNYVPRGSVNTMIPPHSQYYEKGQPRTSAQVREVKRSFNGTRVTRWGNWSWESQGSGFSKKRKSGRFSYIETDRGIETHSVCRNYKYGSLDYRDCRKGAKKYFKNACSAQFRAACGAAEMIP